MERRGAGGGQAGQRGGEESGSWERRREGDQEESCIEFELLERRGDKERRSRIEGVLVLTSSELCTIKNNNDDALALLQ